MCSMETRALDFGGVPAVACSIGQGPVSGAAFQEGEDEQEEVLAVATMLDHVMTVGGKHGREGARESGTNRGQGTRVNEVRDSWKAAGRRRGMQIASTKHKTEQDARQKQVG